MAASNTFTHYTHSEACKMAAHSRRVTWSKCFVLAMGAILLVASDYTKHFGFQSLALAAAMGGAGFVLIGWGIVQMHGIFIQYLLGDPHRELGIKGYEEVIELAKCSPRAEALVREWTASDHFLSRRDLAELKRVVDDDRLAAVKASIASGLPSIQGH